MENCIDINPDISKNACAKNFPKAPRGSPTEWKKFKKLKFSPAKHLSIEKMTLITNITIFLRLVSALAQESLKTREIRENS